MKLMQPKPTEDIPLGNEWVYEVKYDGFRSVLLWDEEHVSLISRNGKDLSNNFPEIISFCKEKKAIFAEFLPIKLDGELVILNTELQANFSLLQQRGRLKSIEKIKHASSLRPAHLLCFDILEIKGKSFTKEKQSIRKKKLKELINLLYDNSSVDWDNQLGFIEAYTQIEEILPKLQDHLGEGIIAKRKDSRYIEGKSHSDWYKIKNWRTLTGFLTKFNQENGYFDVSIYQGEKIVSLGKFKHGLDGEALETIKTLLRTKGEKQGNLYYLPPAICVDIHCLGVHEGELREPQFKQFRFDLQPDQCNVSQLQEALSMFPSSIELTKQNKLFWKKTGISKGDLLLYLRQIAPYMIPFLQHKALTIIRCPDGVHSESFYQKHMPDYGPAFIAGGRSGDEVLLHCGSVEALVWFGNHGTIEYHVPFQLMNKKTPIEIVFDLDPPSTNEFNLAIYAATLLKHLLDQLHLISFVKTSGNKGLQVYIPIPENSLTYQETAQFTQAIALLLEKKHNDIFTTERLKKNRNNRLYIDYIQHGKDKTLIAPYSPRKTDKGTVSAPLFWSEVNESLSPDMFTVINVVDRVKQKGCPFSGYHQARQKQQLDLLNKFLGSSKE
ncbi:DNA ligase D [Aquibacillus rhizosphaerae]|uniref:DNA ligase (ATP) n=1 Tax=Aquibacillus rhizosphaerae TaxID=3051431 RepID=A0ABT7L851_9BACI|nr:DNA ligase D [Aquibacillus sp. LR5S19]MDL4842043.1 DNA ligase D [Aquibacillus sp. LR5S19]